MVDGEEALDSIMKFYLRSSDTEKVITQRRWSFDGLLVVCRYR